MKILITGGTGFIGSVYAEHRRDIGDEVYILTRDVEKAKNKLGDRYKFVKDLLDIHEEIDVIVNLAGENLNGWWSKEKKISIINSRVNTTKMVEKFISRAAKKPKLVISGSAIGIYPETHDDSLDENANLDEVGFTYEVCKLWEDAAMPITSYGVRLCTARLGVVIDYSGGMLKQLILPFKLFLGSYLGSGSQYMSWIHLDDVVQIFDNMIEDENYDGIYNLTSPNFVTNKEFSKILAKKLSRPLFFRIPEFFIKFMFGEMAE